MEIVPIAMAGALAGIVFGMFGAGGSAFATPMLAMAGVPGLVAVAAPLPSMLPASLLGARRYLQGGNLDRRVARLAVIGGVPGVLAGGVASSLVASRQLLVLSGVLLLVVGARVLLPDPAGHAGRCAARRERDALVLALAGAVGFVTGLLANGGGFLLVPAFVLVLGLSAGTASGTSMVTVGLLAIPTLAVHWQLGHIDWRVAAVFGIGSIPGSLVGSQVASYVPPVLARRAFGVLLVGFAAWFLLVEVL